MSQRLGRRQLDEREWDVSVWWLGCAGGAGETTLEELFAGSRAAGHEWPLVSPDCVPARVVLVARSSGRGVAAAQSALRDWASSELRVALLGLVLIADAPGRVPRRVRDRVDRVITRAVPGGRVWRLPWVRAWREGELPSRENAPRQAAMLLSDLQRLTAAGGLSNPSEEADR